MAIKDILLHVESTASMPSRLEAAIGLARDHAAHLTGLFVVTPIEIPGYVEFQIPAEVIRARDEAVQQSVAAARQAFEAETRKAGISAEWRHADGSVVETLGMHGRYADLVVVGQLNSAEAVGSMPDRFILSAGRPVLVVPYVGRFRRIGERIVIAWDASRLAGRAVGDALPVLVGAKEVVVLAINPHSGPRGHGDVPGADITLHLARHGIKATAQQAYAEDVNAADVFLSRIADLGSDLVVMGAYGHARWWELVLGGFTRNTLKHMAVPVLMSH